MRVIIVDDEPRAIELLDSYVSRFSELELAGAFRNGLRALEFLQKNPVDLIFLDINMPQLSGLSLSRLLPREVKVIFTTAYAEYAVESYEVEAVDYLLKPIAFERFARAVAKLLAREEDRPEPAAAAGKEDFLYLKSGSKLYKVNLSEIDYLEKDGNYMTYHCGEKRVLTRQTVREALEILPPSFLQVHKSFIIPIHKIEFIDTAEVKVPGKALPIGKAYREALLKRIEQK